MGCLATFSLREALYEVELRSTFRNGLQQLITPLHSVSPLQQLVSQFYSRFTVVLTRAHAHTYYISFRRALRDKLLRKLHSVTGPQHQTSATCNATFSTVARQVAEKIAQCNRTLNPSVRNGKSAIQFILDDVPTLCSSPNLNQLRTKSQPCFDRARQRAKWN